MPSDSLLGDTLGWGLAILIFLTPLFFKDTHRNLSVFTAAQFVILLHLLVSITNAYIATTLGSELDAQAFHQTAVRLANSSSEWAARANAAYEFWLASIYSIVGPSQFLANQISVLAFALSIPLLLNISRILGTKKCDPWIVLLFGGLPPAWLFGSVSLRESYEVFFLLLCVERCLHFHQTNRLLSLVPALGSAFLLALFHNGFMIYSLFMLGLLIYWNIRSTPKEHPFRISKRRLGFAVTLFGIALMTFLSFDELKTSLYGASEAAIEGKVLNYAETYRSTAAGLSGRTTYNVIFDFSSFPSFLVSLGDIYIHYLFAPFPWQVRNILDFYAATESALRFCLLMAMFASLLIGSLPQRRSKYLLMIIYLSLSLLWSVGTANYGTSIRHHLTTQWILYLLGLPVLLLGLRTKRRPNLRLVNAATPHVG